MLRESELEVVLHQHTSPRLKQARIWPHDHQGRDPDQKDVRKKPREKLKLLT